MNITSNSTKNKQSKKHKSAEIQKASFPKEQVINADLYEPALNEIITTHK